MAYSHCCVILWPSDAMWWHRSGSSLVQVMTCCLAASNRYLIQSWLMITKVPWHSSEGIFMWRLQSVKQDTKLHISRDQWVNEEHWRIRVIELGHYFCFDFGFDSLSIARLGTNFSVIWNKTQTFSVKEMHLTKLCSQNKSHTSPCGGRAMGHLFWVPWRNGTARYRECAVIRLHYGLCNFRAHFSDVIVGAMASQSTGVSIVFSIVCSGADQRKHQSSESLAFARGIHRWPLNSPHKRPVTRKMVPFDDVIIFWVFWGERHRENGRVRCNKTTLRAV